MSKSVKRVFDRFSKTTSLALTLLFAAAMMTFMARALFIRSVYENQADFRTKFNIKYDYHV